MLSILIMWCYVTNEIIMNCIHVYKECLDPIIISYILTTCRYLYLQNTHNTTYNTLSLSVCFSACLSVCLFFCFFPFHSYLRHKKVFLFTLLRFFRKRRLRLENECKYRISLMSLNADETTFVIKRMA